MQTLNRRNFPGRQHPDRVIQFGEGNFLRAFVDWQLDLLNEHTDLDAGIVIVRPIDSDFPPALDTQDGLYTTIIRGLNEQGEAVREPRLIRSVNREINVYRQFDEYLALAHDPNIRFVFSNTTEAGISYHADDRLSDAPPVSFPAKLTRLLYERFCHFDGAADKGWVLLPCELIDYNGVALKELVLRYAAQWELTSTFTAWLNDHNTFCSTLVDRIVTGYPRAEVEALQQEMGYQDTFWDTAEHFYLFVIQGPLWLAEELRLNKLDLNVRIVDDIKPYKERKVAILNGAHTALVPVAFLAGLDTVGESMNDALIGKFVEKTIAEEIVPVLDLPHDELTSFAQAVLSRFRNPFIQHQLLSISLNGMTKFRTRILPQLLTYRERHGELPARLTFALAALIAFYRGERSGEGDALQAYPLQDDAHWLERYSTLWAGVKENTVSLAELVNVVLRDADHWEQDLTQVPGLAAQVTEQLQTIVERGMRAAVEGYC
ncbi:altronate oxidoreductase [Pectobacterium atrosepticum SCRI1043]|uniref:Altronate oxidoreductase n=1 Tax=Pectobacterium atrosepticum (strain SCRI 1043 / ATCC BAA-672) TaxID=218491 RepID=UXAB_PECAS|nr:tagaturonate reductase [Pectobacterium atrosepticum]Q6D9G9.1 RecName: Full=Altronate oxidoreductase; AltName: Full=Tagaturonate dehydrogenase; AltName: Full=Tagaturonate reductase [Pectobacterium atrosepticum SCRI1043]MCL6316753.1 tagaturonate reductase [Pectobacterium atrosepticum]MCL6321296.1 tagaturonate reductase [Pectobacterium atrosepticum]CAG73561.1 altronate oxidoreductase [Pectobacterium atrosepticum SCRI1043]